MDFYSISLSNVTPVKLVTAKANYGIGFLTAFVGSFCSLFGIPNNMFTQKLRKAETLAMEELTANAKAVGADGVMDVRCQIDGLSFLVSGTAYKLSPEEKAKREAEEKAKCDAEEKAKREAEENSKYEVEESNNLNDNPNVPLEDSNAEKPKPSSVNDKLIANDLPIYTSSSSTTCDSATHKKYKDNLGNNIGVKTKDGHWEIDSILNEKVFVCNHCHGIIAFESDFYKDK